MVSQLFLSIAAIGAVVLVLGLCSGWVRRRPLSEPMLALMIGIVLGPAVTGALDPDAWQAWQARGGKLHLLEEVARLTLAIGLMGVALRLPRGYFRQNWRSLAMLIAPVMIVAWLISGALSWFILGIGAWSALLLGACMTPTDPVLASAIVDGRFARENLPGNLRHTLSGEAGANDGLGLLFVALPLLMLQKSSHAALTHWLTYTLLWEVLAAVVVGLVIGVAAGYLLHAAERHHTIDTTSLLSYTVALSFTVLGVCQVIGSDGILAVFVAGRGFTAVATLRERNEEERVQEAVNQFFILPVFVLLGAVLPWSAWAELGWRGIALAVAVLALRRLPALSVMHRAIPTLRRPADALFAGWFGPIGVAAVLYLTQAARESGQHDIWIAGSLVVCASIVAHGMTAAPGINSYARTDRSRSAAA